MADPLIDWATGQPVAAPSPQAGGAGPPLAVKWQANLASPPTQLYITLDDTWQFSVLSATAGQTVTLELRILRADGTIIIDEESIVTVANRTVVTKTAVGVEGWLINASLATASAGVIRGQIFARLRLVRGVTATSTLTYVVMQGYVSTQAALFWPQGLIEAGLSGYGYQVEQTVSNPAAGADWTYTVGPGIRQAIRLVSAQLVCSAAVAVRTVALVISDSVFTNLVITGTTTQAASSAVTYGWAAGLPFGALNPSNFESNPLPWPLYLLAGYQVKSFTSNLQAGDQWGGIRITTEEWVEA